MPTAIKRAVAKKPRAILRRAPKKRDGLPPMPVEKTNLTPAERALLDDRNFVTEDEADFIICERRRRRGGRLIPLQELLKRYGRQPRARHMEG